MLDSGTSRSLSSLWSLRHWRTAWRVHKCIEGQRNSFYRMSHLKKRKRNFRPIFVTFFPIKLACIVPEKNKSHRDNVTLLEILSNWVEHDWRIAICLNTNGQYARELSGDRETIEIIKVKIWAKAHHSAIDIKNHQIKTTKNHEPLQNRIRIRTCIRSGCWFTLMRYGAKMRR